jgi:hypothetical protein
VWSSPTLVAKTPSTVLTQNKSATSNQPAVLFSQNKSVPVINHQPNERARSRTRQTPSITNRQSCRGGSQPSKELIRPESKRQDPDSAQAAQNLQQGLHVLSTLQNEISSILSSDNLPSSTRSHGDITTFPSTSSCREVRFPSLGSHRLLGVHMFSV